MPITALICSTTKMKNTLGQYIETVLQQAFCRLAGAYSLLFSCAFIMLPYPENRFFPPGQTHVNSNLRENPYQLIWINSY